MVEIKFENNLDCLEKDDGEIDNFLKDVLPQVESNGVASVNNSPPSEARLIVFTPPPPSPTRDEEGQEANNSVEEPAVYQELEGNEEKINKISNCHCNEKLKNEIAEMHLFLQVEFGDKYVAFRKNRKHLTQNGIEEKCNPDWKKEKVNDGLHFSKTIKGDNGPLPKPLDLSTSGKNCSQNQTVTYNSEIKRSKESSLVSGFDVGKRKPKESSSSKEEESSAKSKAEKSKAEIERKKPEEESRIKEMKRSSSKSNVETEKESDKREISRKIFSSRESTSSTTSQKRSHSVQSPSDSHSGSQPKKSRLEKPSPEIKFDPTSLKGYGKAQQNFKLCPLCPLIVLSEKLIDHLQERHKEIKNICPGCDQKFASESTFREHYIQKDKYGCAKHKDIKTAKTIKASIRDWFPKIVKLAISVNHEDLDCLKNVQEHPQRGWDIYVRSLRPGKSKRSIFDLFRTFGAVEGVRVEEGTENNRMQCSAFVTMSNYEEAVKAIYTRNGLIVDRRMLYVSFAKHSMQKLIKSIK